MLLIWARIDTYISLAAFKEEKEEERRRRRSDRFELLPDQH